MFHSNLFNILSQKFLHQQYSPTLRLSHNHLINKSPCILTRICVPWRLRSICRRFVRRVNSSEFRQACGMRIKVLPECCRCVTGEFMGGRGDADFYCACTYLSVAAQFLPDNFHALFRAIVTCLRTRH